MWTADVCSNHFWALIEQSLQVSTAKDERVAFLKARLAQESTENIAAIMVCLDDHKERLNTWDMYGAFWYLFQVGSMDSFSAFQSWLVGLGRSKYESLAAGADNVTELSEIRGILEARTATEARDPRGVTLFELREPDFSELDSLVYHAYIRSGGKEDALDDLYAVAEVAYSAVQPVGEEWDISDIDEVRRRLPRTYEYMTRLRQRYRPTEA
ncbi:DUF4240 domain-containing protein [Nonomuraea sp. NPDC049504]|uniref:DUF4240 domain-containing protein n=1 Tax=Nonomuraea sp. NPDC049504 TaxID=3154729 RepID=UPI00342FF974